MHFTSSLSDSLLRRIHTTGALMCIGAIGFGSIFSAFAAKNLNLVLTINPGVLAVDIVDGSYVTVANPSFTLDAIATAFTCQDTPGVLGTSTQKIYVQNPDAADNGWTMTLAASAPTAAWTGTGGSMDFNDPTTSGCTDGGDTDSLKGQLTVDPSGGTLAVGACASCATTSITKGSSNAFNEGTVNSITVLTAASGSNDFGDWTLTDVDVSQTIPAEQVAASDYTLPMTLSVVAS